MKSSIIKQAIELGFEFSDIDEDLTIFEIRELFLHDFFNENSDKLPQIEDECEVSVHGNNQTVNYGGYTCSGEIINFREHWSKPEGEKIYHSDFVLEDDGVMKNMRLYYIQPKTEYNQ